MTVAALTRKPSPGRPARKTSSPASREASRQGHAESEHGRPENEAADVRGTGPQWSFSQVGVHPPERAAYRGPSPAIRRALHTPGEPLESSSRKHFEHRFGHDFSQVRIHTGDQAAEAAASLHASAFTLGSDIVFGRGRYSPATAPGRLLLLHELRHVEQQRSAAPTDRPPIDSPASPHELQARTLLDPRNQPLSEQRLQCAPGGGIGV